MENGVQSHFCGCEGVLQHEFLPGKAPFDQGRMIG
jgi:hypothetical protein